MSTIDKIITFTFFTGLQDKVLQILLISKYSNVPPPILTENTTKGAREPERYIDAKYLIKKSGMSGMKNAPKSLTDTGIILDLFLLINLGLNLATNTFIPKTKKDMIKDVI